MYNMNQNMSFYKFDAHSSYKLFFLRGQKKAADIW